MSTTGARVVAIIGSSKFRDQHMGVAQRETLSGKIVLMLGFYHHVDRLPITENQKALIDQLSYAKIDMADEVIVVNVHGYVGETTRKLINYARQQDKAVHYLEDAPMVAGA